MKPILTRRSGLPRCGGLLRSGQPAKIVAFGTSLTLGGAYLARLMPALSATYGDERATLINRGRNGYSTLAATFRVQDDVVPHAPDVVLIEFAHNDVSQNLVDFIPAAVEGMLGQLRRARPNCEVVFVYLALPGSAAAGPTPAIAAYEALAERHGIPSIDLAARAEELVAGGLAEWRGDGPRALTFDGVHHGPGAAALLGEPFAEAFLALLEPGPAAGPPRPLGPDALTVVARVRAADCLSTGAWAVRPPEPAELRGAGIDEEGVAEARERGATLRLTFTGTNAFVWVSGSGAVGVRIAETNASYRVAVDAVAKWMWCALTEPLPAGRYTLDVIALDAGIVFGDIGIVGAG